MPLILKCHILFLLNFLPIVVRLSSVIQKNRRTPNHVGFYGFLFYKLSEVIDDLSHTLFLKNKVWIIFFSSVLVAKVEYSLDDRLLLG